MRKKLIYVFTIICFFIFYKVKSQVNAPSLRCVSVAASGDITLQWIIPSDPLALFTRYEIFTSSSKFGPYSLAGNVSVYLQNNYTHVGANGNIQSQYYYIKTISNGTVVSNSSDTLRSIFLNLGNPGNGKAILNWNATKIPLLPSASTTYTISRKTPSTAWTIIYTGSALSLSDTITVCTINYDYKVETSDGMGCISQSNISGSLFNDKIAPTRPVLDSISVNASGQTMIGWEPSPSKDATGYVIYKFMGGIWSPITTVIGRLNTSYVYSTSTANSGQESYNIAAIDSCTNISPLLNLEQKTIFLSSTFNLCSRTNNLSWLGYVNLTLGVLRYDVYCSTNGGPFLRIGSTAGTSYSHTNLIAGKTYCYFVKVVNSAQSITANSNVICMTAKAAASPTYVYIRSVSVNLNNQVEVTYYIDNSRPYKGATIFKSYDGITFKQVDYQAFSGAYTQTYIDSDVETTKQNYYYKIQISDSCGNPGPYSNSSKTILLKVENDEQNIFYNKLSWDDYSSWSGSVASYNIYRAVDGVFNPNPIKNVNSATRAYTDDVQDYAAAQGKFSYYVEAVEGGGNVYGFVDAAKSNPVSAYVEAGVYVPNAFAPEGQNKIWLPVTRYVEKEGYKVIVYNRWGSKVFETSSDTVGWDGKDANDDVYIYTIEYKNSQNEIFQLKGTITLVH